jgi:imidazolonepropionase-like amidohydrolase
MKMRLKLLTKAILAVGLLFSFPVLLQAQSDSDAKSPATRTYAVKNATIVQAPGKVIEGGTVLIKDGLITAVGKNVTVLTGTFEIDGSNMFVYPGFIDGLTHNGVKSYENPERPRDLKPNNPPNNIAGITPEYSVLDKIDLGAKAMDDMRKAGFTVAQIAPQGRMLPGANAVILYADKATSDQLVLKNNTSLFAQFQGGQGVYPGTVIAVMAKWRELYINAQNQIQNERVYASNSAGINRPAKNRTLEAFYPVIQKQYPITFHAAEQLDVRRALSLQKEFGFDLVIANMKEGWGLESAIKASNAKVLLSMDLPEKKEASKEANEEAKAREERRADSYAKYVSQASAYEKAGIKFAFSSLSGNASNLKKNLGIMTENGLSETAALTALTTTPAEMLGLSNRIGSVDQGKIANLVITSGNYFSKDSDVRYVFVDGIMYEYEARPAKANGGNGGPAADINGKWNYKTETPMGSSEGELNFTNSNGTYEGTMTMPMAGPDPLPLSNIEVDGSNLSFDISMNMGGQSIGLSISGTITGSEFKGTMDTGQFGAFGLTAVKNPGKFN